MWKRLSDIFAAGSVAVLIGAPICALVIFFHFAQVNTTCIDPMKRLGYWCAASDEWFAAFEHASGANQCQLTPSETICCIFDAYRCCMRTDNEQPEVNCVSK